MAVTISGTNGVTFPDNSSQNTAATGFGFKNRIINGAMGIWQRGTSSTTDGVYGSADRWLQNTGTSGTWSQSTDVPTGFKYSMSVAGTNFPQLIQRIESVNCTDLVGQSVTYSFWLKQTSGAGASSITAYLKYANAADNFGGGATNVTGSIAHITATSSWAQYSFTVPSMPTETANGIELIVYANTVGSATFLITGVQLEKDATATSFDYRPYGTELALCQRYYYRLTGAANDFLALAYAQTTTTTVALIPFLVQMRTAPTSLEQSGTAGHYAINRCGAAGSTTCSAVPSFSTATTNQGAVVCTVASGLSSSSAGSLYLISASGYLGWSAEL